MHGISSLEYGNYYQKPSFFDNYRIFNSAVLRRGYKSVGTNPAIVSLTQMLLYPIYF